MTKGDVITILINGHYIGEFSQRSWLDWYDNVALKNLLQEAVEDEDYEKACQIRDEIKRRAKK